MNQPFQTPQPSAPPAGGPRRLYRSLSDRRIAGLCGGIAEYLGIDTLLVRILFLLTGILGFGVVLYILGWIIIPDNPAGLTVTPRPPSANARYFWGMVLILLGVVFLAEANDWDWLVPWRWRLYWPDWLSWGVMFSVLLIGLGLLMIYRSFTTPPAISATTTFPAFQTASSGGPVMNSKRLTRSVKERMVGGVCGGLAEYFNIDPSLVRILWVIMTFVSGFFFGIVIYIIMMVVVPEQRLDSSESSATRSPG
ncbi:MAG: PspC domain-containing protein [candidate division KSB1 bacterium]|nr:PspC domain-containing protein [candidate division KSB1 bacterium]MDZ7272635.1 PspC domain-containing protein [candidate division KSB1 bacterium]MDZ7284343.1 PspC domain-containing protein [candidate division KSB1 bacterium]MDZ7297261.1 PspC domain-containing protein [candidate division KSB1 bacterium]MDZ7307563.1 PspC domain-containing protein [candidate division KSB1 bacterium]